MMKRVVALALCLLMLLPCIVACSKPANDKGAYVRMFLTEKIYDFDPLNAFENADNLQIVSMLFSGLFYADEDGEPQKDLVEEYEYVYDEKEDRYYLSLTLRDTLWSDGVQLTAMHVQYAFLRLFASDVSHPATAMLYEIKNARKIVSGDAKIDSLQVIVVNNKEVEIEFEQDVDIDAFLRVLCSPALYPVRDDIVESNKDWAKKTTTMVFSGPFIVRKMNYDEKDGFILERNAYYLRDRQVDDLDEYVTPYRLICDYTTPIEEQLKKFDAEGAGAIYYLGNIPLAGRTTTTFADLMAEGELTDANSTHVYYMNEKALIGGTALFADPAVRKALSLALDREAIAEALVLAKAADALVPGAILNSTDDDETFRNAANESISTLPNVKLAKAMLDAAGIKASDCSFSITVAAYDTDHVAAAELAKAAWNALGFKVSVKKLGVETAYQLDENGNKVLDSKTKKPIELGYVNDLYKDAYKAGDFEVIALDLVATGVDAFSYLAPFATAFSGNAMDMNTATNPEYKLNPHITGYQSAAYDAKIEEAYAEKNPEKRAALLHEAEEILLSDMPVIPVVYNVNFSLASGELGKIERNFFCNAHFQKTSLSGYWEIALAEKFVEEIKETEEK